MLEWAHMVAPSPCKTPETPMLVLPSQVQDKLVHTPEKLAHWDTMRYEANKFTDTKRFVCQ
jgi:hypothetical protein